MNLRSNLPVVATDHAKDRLLERFGVEVDAILKLAFKEGHAKYDVAKKNFRVTYLDMTMIVMEKADQRPPCNLIVTVLFKHWSKGSAKPKLKKHEVVRMHGFKARDYTPHTRKLMQKAQDDWQE